MNHTLPLTTTDLTIADNVTQARHELHRAIDTGDRTVLAAWTTKRGESALAAAEEGPDHEDDFSSSVDNTSTDAADAALAKLEDRLDAMTQIVGRTPLDLSALAGALEDSRAHLSSAQEALAGE